MTRPAGWICCQLGAREHYAIPRALALARELQCLLTDAWVRPGSLLGLCHRNLRERFHPELAGSSVRAWTAGLLAFELLARARRLSGWPLVMARNEWFQGKVSGERCKVRERQVTGERCKVSVEEKSPISPLSPPSTSHPLSPNTYSLQL